MTKCTKYTLDKKLKKTVSKYRHLTIKKVCNRLGGLLSHNCVYKQKI